MRALRLARIAAEAEGLRLRHGAQRTVVRAILGLDCTGPPVRRAGLRPDRGLVLAAIWAKTSAPNRRASAISPRIARTTVRCAPWRRQRPSASAAMRAGGGPAWISAYAAERIADGGCDQDRQQRLLAHLARRSRPVRARNPPRYENANCAAGRVGERRGDPVLHERLDLLAQPGNLCHRVAVCIAGVVS